MSAPSTKSPTVALDWGTSNLRAFLIAPDGSVRDQRVRPWGILRLPEPIGDPRSTPRTTQYDAALAGIAGDWLATWPTAWLLACGMVGSRQGWREARYLPVPADPAEIAAAAVDVTTATDRVLRILPGLSQGSRASQPGGRQSPPPDVMRGEETQVVGALGRQPGLADDAWLVLPGTHSKWVRVVAGRITGFATHLTGELFDVLGRHTILSQSISAPVAVAGQVPAGGQNDEVRGFAIGVGLAAEGENSLSNLLFGIRARTLLEDCSPVTARGLLSGILVGHEINVAVPAVRRTASPVVLIGEPALCERYRNALALVGMTVAAVMDNTAADGMFRFALELDAARTD
ncbi:MAG: 2-dehydro-3-deoxygalactonokinase [Burkholderiaceae bacterium]